MSKLSVNIELSPDMFLVLGVLSQFYGKDKREVIELALVYLSNNVKIIVETIDAKKLTDYPL